MNSETTTDRKAGAQRRPGETTSQDPPQAPDARRPARPGRRPRPGWPSELPKSPVRPASPIRPPGPGRSGRPVRTSLAPPDMRPAAPPELRPAGPHTTAPHTTMPGTATPPAAAVRRPPAPPAGHVGTIRRTPFVLLLLGLLGGGLVCLLVVNTTLAANSIEIQNLQQRNTAGAQRVQQLEQQVAQAQTATVIAKEARMLGLRPESKLIFIDLRSRKILTQPGVTARELAGRRAPVKAARKGTHKTHEAVRSAAARGAGQ